MTLSRYAFQYNSMIKIGANKFYCREFNQGSFEEFYIENNRFFVEVSKNIDPHNSILKMLICIAYGEYKIIPQYGYTPTANGLIRINSGLNIIKSGPYFTNYFNTKQQYIFTVPTGEHTLTIIDDINIPEPNNITKIQNGVKYIDLQNWGNSLGFALGIEKDDTAKIIYLSAIMTQ